MQLERLFPRGTRLAQVPDDFVGMSPYEWKLRQIQTQAERWYASLPKDAKEKAPLAQQALWTPRDSYGV